MLPSLGLNEPVVTALVTLLETEMPAMVAALNATITDSYLIDEPVQYLSYVPIPSVLQGGMPAIGVQRMPVTFQDDLIVNMDALHEFAVVAILSHTDHQTLTWQLDRTAQAIANVIQADRRLLPAGGVMQTAGLWNVKFIRTEPGPVLGDLNPTEPEAPPRTYLSWTAILFSGTRTEV